MSGTFEPNQTLTAAELNLLVPPVGELLGGTGTTFTIVNIGSGLAITSGTLAATGGGGSGTVTQVVAQGGPFLANGTVTSSGTISNSVTSLTANALLLGAGSGAVAALGSTGTTSTLLHGNASGPPTFGAVALGSEVSGTLGVAFGGTGLGAVGFSGGVLAYVSSGALASSAVLAAHHLVIGGGPGLTPATIGGLGTSGQPLTSAGAGNDPLFAALNLASSTAVTGRLDFGHVGTVAATSLLGNATGAGSDAASIAIGTGLTLTGSPGTISATGGASSLIVTDGTTTVNPASKLTFTGATVADLTGGNAGVTVTGGGSSLTISDGSSSVANVGSILVNGGSISGTTPNATLTVTGGGGTVVPPFSTGFTAPITSAVTAVGVANIALSNPITGVLAVRTNDTNSGIGAAIKPVVTDFTLTVQASFNGSNPAGSQTPVWGIVLSDGTKFVVFGLEAAGSTSAVGNQVIRYSSNSAFNAAPYTGQTTMGGVVFLKVVYNSGTPSLTYEISQDGIDYDQVYTETSLYFTPTQAGVGSYFISSGTVNTQSVKAYNWSGL